jgi:hypothetical protein
VIIFSPGEIIDPAFPIGDGAENNGPMTDGFIARDGQFSGQRSMSLGNFFDLYRPYDIALLSSLARTNSRSSKLPLPSRIHPFN